MSDSTPSQSMLGFRVWTVDERGLLISPGSGYQWQPGWNHASCSKHSWWRRGHSAPARECGCGFSAFYDLEQAKRAALLASQHQGLGCVIGAVAGTGTIQLETQGFRAERCRILALSARTIDSATGLFLAAERYGLEVLDLRDLAGPERYSPACLPLKKMQN